MCWVMCNSVTFEILVIVNIVHCLFGVLESY